MGRRGDLILKAEGPDDQSIYVCICLSELDGRTGMEFGYCLLECLGFNHCSNLRVFKDNVIVEAKSFPKSQ